ncbi:RDD family protein [Pannus brasiliensis CCIBt3594]|uniref:RDD family protein n=1 Tax=Pannus brasiliensis CCIBt3594 TaxID=1427578 RepID=A0AAW9QND4_9CHRO
MSFCINPRCPKPKNQTDSRYCLSCGSDLLLAGKYRVTRLLSEKGGFGNTYEAIDLQGNPKVLKVLTYTAPKAIALFQQEAKVLQQLNHPGIPRGESYFIYYPRDDEEALHCMVMEKIEGTDLEEYERSRKFQPIEPPLALDWLSQLGKILHEVHRHQFFHRDIKPSNIILKPDGQLVLIDFGAARQVTGTVLAGGQNTGIYTPGYAPPEQSSGHSVPQSDFYALGKTFVFLLTGKDPSDPKIYDINTNEFHWRKYAPAVPEPLADFLDELMAEKPIDRPANTSILLRKINALKADPDRTSPKTGLLSRLEALSRAWSNKTVSPDSRPLAVPDRVPKVAAENQVKSSPVAVPKGVPAPVPDALAHVPAEFSTRLKASIFDSIFLLIIAALAGGYLCLKLQEFEFIDRFPLDFNQIRELAWFRELSRREWFPALPGDLYIPKKLWMYYAAGTSALGTTLIGLGLAIALVLYHAKMQLGFANEEIAILLFLLLGIGIKWLYFVFFEICFKATIGKIFFRLSVTDARGERISLARANRRYWCKLFSAIPLYGGFFLAAWTKKKRALHDRLTGTRIVKK